MSYSVCCDAFWGRPVFWPAECPAPPFNGLTPEPIERTSVRCYAPPLAQEVLGFEPGDLVSIETVAVKRHTVGDQGIPQIAGSPDLTPAVAQRQGAVERVRQLRNFRIQWSRGPRSGISAGRFLEEVEQLVRHGETLSVVIRRTRRLAWGGCPIVGRIRATPWRPAWAGDGGGPGPQTGLVGATESVACVPF